MKQHILYILLAAIMLSSCFKEDDMVTPHDPGELSEGQVAMEQNYIWQVYFDLESEMAVSSNHKDIYDLAFENGDGGWHILLNTASFMYAASTGSIDFNAPIDTVGFDWKFDRSDGNLDSTAIGQYFTYGQADSSIVFTNEVYVLNRGYDISADHRGLKKVQFGFVNDSIYSIRYANLDGSEEGEFVIEKEAPDVSSFSYFSFNNGGEQVYPEPQPDEYDLLFTQYTTLLYTDEGDPYPYLLTGVLVNRQFVETVRDTSLQFDQIDYDVAVAMNFNSQLDNIGWDWKELDGDVTGGGPLVYNIVEGLQYIIRDPEGLIYKFRFTSFYNELGEKGYPTFEYQRL